MSNNRALGYLPDLPKVEDYTETHSAVAALLANTSLAARSGAVPAAGGAPAGVRPARVDLRPWFPPVDDQGGIGSCTANAAIGMLGYNEKRAHGTFTEGSRMFLYKAERDLLGWTGDTGAFLRTAMEALVLFGAPPEKYWPYDGSSAAQNTRLNLEPPAFCYAFGSSFQALTYFRHDPAGAVTSAVLDSIKTYVAAGIPCMFGFPVYPEYDNPLPGALIGYPTSGQSSRGGHANVVAGYDDNLMIGPDKGALLVRNSWGQAWADAGYGWLSYKYVTSGLANDFWSMITGKWIDTGRFG